MGFESFENLENFGLTRICSELQLNILRFCVRPSTYKDLCDEFKLSYPSLAYHLNGNLKNLSIGLISLNLLAWEGRRKRRLVITKIGVELLERLEEGVD